MTERVADPTSGQRATHDSDVPDALVAFMAGGWLEEPADVRPQPQLERHRERRTELSRAYRGCYVLVPCGMTPGALGEESP